MILRWLKEHFVVFSDAQMLKPRFASRALSMMIKSSLLCALCALHPSRYLEYEKNQ